MRVLGYPAILCTKEYEVNFVRGELMGVRIAPMTTGLQTIPEPEPEPEPEPDENIWTPF